MVSQLLRRMTGEELLLHCVLGGERLRQAVARELDRRALFGGPAANRQGRSRPVRLGRFRSGQVAA